MTVVYCYDLVPLRSKTPWTRPMDDWLRDEYFPGLSLASLTSDAQHKFPKSRLTEPKVRKRLCEIGLYSRRKNRQ